MSAPTSPAPTGAEGGSVVADLLMEARLASPSGFGVLVAAQLARLGVEDPGLWLVDVQQHFLVPFGAGEQRGAASDELLAVDGTLAGWAYRSSEAQHAEGADGVAVWVPLVDGADRLGVIGGRVPAWTPALGHDLWLVATATAHLVASQQQFGDAVVRTRRLRSASLPAEVQWSLLPPLSFSTARATVAGALEPAYDIAGDSFDYAVGEDTVHLAVFDAMGHGLTAALMASVAVGGYRHARRGGLGLGATYDALDGALSAQFGPDRFVTGILAELDLHSGELAYILAGHHPGLLLRSGRIVRHLHTSGRLPFGLGRELGPMPAATAWSEVGHESLEPGDRILLYTDGVVEARDLSGSFFGLERLEELLVREDASASSAPE
ncbi:MAG: PP2C family protein-serine/threonine phosphatase, partial [Acidimicrobiales bacterium]